MQVEQFLKRQRQINFRLKCGGFPNRQERCIPLMLLMKSLRKPSTYTDSFALAKQDNGTSSKCTRHLTLRSWYNKYIHTFWKLAVDRLCWTPQWGIVWLQFTTEVKSKWLKEKIITGLYNSVALILRLIFSGRSATIFVTMIESAEPQRAIR